MWPHAFDVVMDGARRSERIRSAFGVAVFIRDLDLTDDLDAFAGVVISH
jgi:hypothetical protein